MQSSRDAPALPPKMGKIKTHSRYLLMKLHPKITPNHGHYCLITAIHACLA
jgi:hypothetical protein